VPTVLRLGSHRFFFYSADGQEPPHVHIARDRAKAKFWLEPVAFASASGFSARELLDIQSLLAAHHQVLLNSWHDYFGSAH
jgi:hypothetical protein